MVVARVQMHQRNEKPQITVSVTKPYKSNLKRRFEKIISSGKSAKVFSKIANTIVAILKVDIWFAPSSKISLNH